MDKYFDLISECKEVSKEKDYSEQKKELSETKEGKTSLHIEWRGEGEKEDKLVQLTKGTVKDSYSTREFNHLYLSFPSTSKAQEALKKVKAARWSWVFGVEIVDENTDEKVSKDKRLAKDIIEQKELNLEKQYQNLVDECRKAAKEKVDEGKNYLISGNLVALYAPGKSNDEIRSKIEELLGYDREDIGPEAGDHGYYLGPGPKITRVLSINPDIYVGSLSDYGPNESRSLARKLMKQLDITGGKVTEQEEEPGLEEPPAPPEEVKDSSESKTNEQESQKDFARKFGVFGYTGDDENTYAVHFDTEEEAKAAAVELARELNGKDLAYVEVWQADKEGRWGATGEPIWKREYSAKSKTSVEKKELNLEKQYQNLVDECRKAAKEKVSSESKVTEQEDEELSIEDAAEEQAVGLLKKTSKSHAEIQTILQRTFGLDASKSEEILKRALRGVDESKVTEQEEEPGLEEPPAPPEEVKEPETEDMEMRKEYLGKSEDTHYYFITTEGAVGEAEDLLITDQEGVKKYSAKDHNMDVSEEGIADFIIKAIQDVKIEQIERSIFMKYILPKLEEETPEEEIIGEPEEKEPKEEKPKEKPKEEPTKIPPEEEPLESIKSKTCEFTKIFEGKIDLITTSNLKKFLADGEDLIKRSKEINLSTAGLEAVVSKIQGELDKREKDKKTTEGKSPQQGDKEATQIKKLKEWEEGEDFENLGDAVDTLLEYSGDFMDHGMGTTDREYKETIGSMLKKMKDQFGADKVVYSLKKAIASTEGIDIAEIRFWAKTLGVKAGSLVEGKNPQQGDKEATQIKKLSEMKVTDLEGNTFDVHLVDDGAIDTVIDIGGREFTFSNDYVSMLRDEDGALSEEGLKELALDALANIEEEEYAELIAKGKGEEEEEEEESNPYLLSGEELKRAEAAAKRGEGQYKKTEPDEEQEEAYAEQVEKDIEKKYPESDLDRLVARRDELKAKEEAGTLTADMKEELVDLEKRIKELGGAVESKTDEIKKGDTNMAEINKDKKQSTLESIKADIANWVNSVAEKKDLIDLWSKISENDIKDEQVVDDKVDEVKPENKADEAKVEGEDAEAIAKKSAAHHAKQDKTHTAKPTQGKQLGDPKEDADKIAKQSDALHKKQDKSHAIKAGDLKQLKSSSESTEEPEEDEEIDPLNDDIQNTIDEMLDSDEVLDEAKKKLVGKSGRPLKKGAAGRSRGKCVFPYEHSKVTDKKDHFPINTENQARNALGRVNQYKKAPKWYEGSIESLVKTVANAVKKAYPDIKVTKAAEKPGKGPKESKIPVEEEQISISERKGLERLNELLGLNG